MAWEQLHSKGKGDASNKTCVGEKLIKREWIQASYIYFSIASLSHKSYELYLIQASEISCLPQLRTGLKSVLGWIFDRFPLGTQWGRLTRLLSQLTSESMLITPADSVITSPVKQTKCAAIRIRTCPRLQDKVKVKRKYPSTNSDLQGLIDFITILFFRNSCCNFCSQIPACVAEW